MILTLLLIVALFFALAYVRTSLRIWSLMLVAAIGTISYIAKAPATLASGLIAVALILAAVVNLTQNFVFDIIGTRTTVEILAR